MPITDALKDFFWESFYEDSSYDIVSAPQNLAQFGRLQFKRNQDFQLSVSFKRTETNISALKEMNSMHSEPGRVLGDSDYASIEALMEGYQQVFIERFHVTNMQAKLGRSISIAGAADNIRIDFLKTDTPKHLIYWIANGEQAYEFPYTRHTNITATTNFDVDITGLKAKATRKAKLISGYSCLLLRAYGKLFYFGYVSPKTTGNIPGSFILLKPEDRFEPNQVFTILRCLGFIMGRRLDLLGSVCLDHNLEAKQKVFYSLGGTPESWCSLHSEPPIPIGIRNRRGSWSPETELTGVIEKFSEYENEFDLNTLVNYIFKSQELPMSIKMQPLAAVFDSLMNKWFRSDRSPSKGKVNRGIFEEVIAEYLPQIASKLAGVSNSKKILKNIRKANRMASVDRIELFFKELGLPIGSTERRVLARRNAVIHETRPFDDSQAMVSIVGGFYSIVCRVILRILEYQGDYVDYGKIGHPKISMDSPLH